MIGRIATGEIKDERELLSSAAAEMGRKGGKARAENMTPERRTEVAQKAAAKRWETPRIRTMSKFRSTHPLAADLDQHESSDPHRDALRYVRTLASLENIMSDDRANQDEMSGPENDLRQQNPGQTTTGDLGDTPDTTDPELDDSDIEDDDLDDTTTEGLAGAGQSGQTRDGPGQDVGAE